MGDIKVLSSAPLYVIVFVVIAFVAGLCGVFVYKSYKAGIKIGMSKDTLKTTIISSITFTIIPSISILLGVVALSGTLGIPLPWMRLSVIGALHYETTVAEIAATSVGLTGLNAAEMTMTAFTTIAMVMGIGIIWGAIICIFFLKKYLAKFSKNSLEQENNNVKKKKGFGDTAMVAMFVGLCSAYVCSYIGLWATSKTILPLAVAVFGGLAMWLFTYLKEKNGIAWLDNFSLAASMLFAMAMAVVLTMLGVIK